MWVPIVLLVVNGLNFEEVGCACGLLLMVFWVIDRVRAFSFARVRDVTINLLDSCAHALVKYDCWVSSALCGPVEGMPPQGRISPRLEPPQPQPPADQ